MKRYARRLDRLIGEIEAVQTQYAQEIAQDTPGGLQELNEAKDALYRVISNSETQQ